MRTQADIDPIMHDVQSRLDARRRSGGPELFIPPGAYSLDDGWLILLVSPGTPGIHAYEYVDALSKVEHDLRADGVDHVILVPAFTD